jgi:hypothetical protein
LKNSLGILLIGFITDFFWGNEAFFLGNPENGTKKVKKPKGKETIYTDFLNKFQFKKLDTIEDPHDKHTFEDQCCSRVTPLNKLCGCCFFIVCITFLLRRFPGAILLLTHFLEVFEVNI